MRVFVPHGLVHMPVGVGLSHRPVMMMLVVFVMNMRMLVLNPLMVVLVVVAL